MATQSNSNKRCLCARPRKWKAKICIPFCALPRSLQKEVCPYVFAHVCCCTCCTNTRGNRKGLWACRAWPWQFKALERRARSNGSQTPAFNLLLFQSSVAMTIRSSVSRTNCLLLGSRYSPITSQQTNLKPVHYIYCIHFCELTEKFDLHWEKNEWTKWIDTLLSVFEQVSKRNGEQHHKSTSNSTNPKWIPINASHGFKQAPGFWRPHHYLHL